MDIGYFFHCICSFCRRCNRCVYLFVRISMAHFNPPVTLGFLITKHITKNQLFLYIVAEITGALLGSVFVKYMIGIQALFGFQFFRLFLSSIINICSRDFSFCFANGSHFNSSPPYKWLERFWRISNWWWHLGLDIFFIASISGASMNPARSLACFIIRTFWKSMDISDYPVRWNINNSNCFQKISKLIVNYSWYSEFTRGQCFHKL
jgi:Major intrinsic protein